MRGFAVAILFAITACAPTPIHQSPSPVPSSLSEKQVLVGLFEGVSLEDPEEAKKWKDYFKPLERDGRSVSVKLFPAPGSAKPAVQLRIHVGLNEARAADYQHLGWLLSAIQKAVPHAEELYALEIGIWFTPEFKAKRDKFGNLPEREVYEEMGLWRAVYKAETLRKINIAYFEKENSLDIADAMAETSEAAAIRDRLIQEVLGR